MHDYHTHFIPNEVLEWVRTNHQSIRAEWKKHNPAKEEFLIINGKWGFELKKEFIDSTLYIKNQEKAGVSHSLLSPVPQLFMYDFDDQLTTEASRVYNQALARLAAEFPNRFSALGTIPLQNSTAAAMILGEAMNLGLKGAIIGPGSHERMLSDDFFNPLFEEANRLKAIIFIHPLLAEDPRIQKRMMPNLIGVPWETTISAADLLLSGITDRFPHIKFIFAHGGGYLPYQLGRLDKGFQEWPAVSAKLSAPPSEYAKRFWYDNVLWNEESVNFLIKTVGANRVLPGSDYPFDLSVWPPAQNELFKISTFS